LCWHQSMIGNGSLFIRKIVLILNCSNEIYDYIILSFFDFAESNFIFEKGVESKLAKSFLKS
jgi:hypothetical protein